MPTNVVPAAEKPPDHISFDDSAQSEHSDRNAEHSDRNGDIASLNVRRGDCEDGVLAKRAALIVIGVPAGALRIAADQTHTGIPYSVHVVCTNHGDFALNNLNNSVNQSNQAGPSPYCHAWIRPATLKVHPLTV